MMAIGTRQASSAMQQVGSGFWGELMRVAAMRNSTVQGDLVVLSQSRIVGRRVRWVGSHVNVSVSA
jgi:hypothetical protein